MDRLKSSLNRRQAMGVGAAMALTGVGAQAQSKWPDKPVKLVVGFPPGGATDVVARIVATPLGEVLGTSIVIENRPGAASNVAMAEVARAPADGYTVLIAPTTVESANPFLYKTPVNPATDLLPVAGLCRFQLHMVVRTNFPAKDVAELIAFAKKNPGKVTYSSAGAGTTPHLIGELFLQQAGIQAVHVPYRGSAPALQAVMAGEVDFVMDPGISFQHVRAGKVNMFAVASPTRSRQFPDVSTLGEKGVPGIDHAPGLACGCRPARPTIFALVSRVRSVRCWHSPMFKSACRPSVARRFIWTRPSTGRCSIRKRRPFRA